MKLSLLLLLLITSILFLLLPNNIATPLLPYHHPRKQQGIAVKEAMGIEKELLKAGNGTKPARGQTVTVQCTGYGKNGDLTQKFWSTKDPGQEPFQFKLGMGKVIKGWDEGVLGMDIGEIARLKCSPDYAYGAGGFPAWGIQPNSVLVFEIEVLSAA